MLRAGSQTSVVVLIEFLYPFERTLDIENMSSKNILLERQRVWATTAGHDVDRRGYLSKYELNLRQPISIKAKNEFANGSGSELERPGDRPAKMRALHSSSGLVVNVFDYWTGRDTALLGAALGLDSPILSMAFEDQFSTGLPGMPPNLDLGIRLESGITVGIESKFTEWLTPKSPKAEPFKQKYFPDGIRTWERKGLPMCQALAADVQNGTEQFRYLDVPQLLKHALGLATKCPGMFALHYLYYDCVGPESEEHRSEIRRFMARVGREIGFSSLTYQELFERFSGFEELHGSEYLAYLKDRYFDS